jgi:Family of unknown function (DUF6328)
MTLRSRRRERILRRCNERRAGHHVRVAESQKERVDRELIELLNELRVALPGVQVLFAFLLAIPFASHFDRVTDFERDVYFVALLAAVLSSGLLIAPSAYHRLLFRQAEKERLLLHANRLAIAGLTALAVSLLASILLVSEFLFGGVTASIVTSIGGLAIALLWYALPLRLRVSRES